MKIIFFGTPLFAANVLSFLVENHIQIQAIVTKPDRPQGRSGKPTYSAVKKRAEELNLTIPLFQPEKASDPIFAKELQSFQADLFVVVAYGEIIKKNLLEMPSLGCINLHASLLPKYRGAAPMQFALLNGDQETGVTIMEMAEKMDAGAIISQAVVPIPVDMNLAELEAELCLVGSNKLLEIIKKFEKGKVEKTPQDHTKATYVKKIDPSMAEMDWKASAQTLHNRIRAFSPKPGAWCMIRVGEKTRRLKILKSSICQDQKGTPGETLVFDRQTWVVACGEKALQILEVQLEGKKRMVIEDFLRGHFSPPTFIP